MSSSIGSKIKIQLFGQSHSEGLGVVIDGLPPNEVIDLEKINCFLKRRQGGNNSYSTERKEADNPTILSGIVDNKTCGAPLCAIFENGNIKSGDYDELRVIPRPSHADLNAYLKYDGANDVRGGGHFSGRLTLPLCFAGAVCAQILERRGIKVGAHVASIGDIDDAKFSPTDITQECLDCILKASFPVLAQGRGEEMISLMEKTAKTGDSVGGVIECAIIGAPQGLGEPIFDGLENKLSAMLFGIPAIRGVEFGEGFIAARMTGSAHNDEYFYEDGKIRTKTNHAGGIIGGISTGEPIIFRAAIKPTPSIASQQASVNLQTKQNQLLIIKGRHDPCIVPRAVPCIEAAAAIVILDMLEG